MSRGFRSDPERLLLCSLGASCSTGREIPESQLTAHSVIIARILLQSCGLVSTIVKISFPQERKIILCFTEGPGSVPPADSLLTR